MRDASNAVIVMPGTHDGVCRVHGRVTLTAVCSVTLTVSVSHRPIDVLSPVCRMLVRCHWAAGTTGLMQAMMELRSLRATTGVPPAGFLSM